MYQRFDSAGSKEAARVPGLRHALHAGASPWCHHGVERGRLCGLLPLSPEQIMTADLTANCPMPLNDHPQVMLAHGGGGRLMDQLIAKMFAPAFANPWLAQRHDGALLDLEERRLAFTTDSYVVHPLFFPGGDIGTLAINGTVNDLVMCGARPRYLSAGFLVEEG